MQLGEHHLVGSIGRTVCVKYENVLLMRPGTQNGVRSPTFINMVRHCCAAAESRCAGQPGGPIARHCAAGHDRQRAHGATRAHHRRPSLVRRVSV